MPEKIMIIDGDNRFFASYAVSPLTNKKNEPIGGIDGFLQSLQKLLKDFQPSKVFICWDGYLGKHKRREIIPEYKDKRSTPRTNFKVSLTEEEIKENIKFQKRTLREFLEYLPFYQIHVKTLEADDLISKLCEDFKDSEKIIISSDKDFLQLVDEKCKYFRPIQDEYFDELKIVEKYHVHPNNFLLARSLEGDTGDNLKGVERVGMKTIVKLFPEFTFPDKVELSNILKKCENEKLKSYKNIQDSKLLIEKNLKVMNLRNLEFSEDEMSAYNEQLSKELKMEEIKFLKETSNIMNGSHTRFFELITNSKNLK